MARDDPTSDRVWPETGLWAASFRVMFPLAALWAALAVGLWQWGGLVWPNLELTVGWHVHEMSFGFGGSALAGYALTACSSWTGRAPVGGWRLMWLAGLWVVVRIALLTPLEMADWVAAIASLAFFWTIAALLVHEMRRGGKGVRPFLVLFCGIAGIGSALWIIALSGGAQPGSIWPVLGFALLLSAIGSRMVPAFLAAASASGRQDSPPVPVWITGIATGLLIGGAFALFAGLRAVAAALIALAALALVAQILRWPWRPAARDGLLAMLGAAFLWLPVGLFLLAGHVPAGWVTLAVASHVLMMGAMGGLVMAVSSRAFARRVSGRLRARRPMIPAFALIALSVPLRLFGALDLAAGVWIAGWVLYLAMSLFRLGGPVPRPVFSGARDR